MSEIKTNKISSVSTNGDITLDPDGTGNTIVASGNVGIGETSPLGTVHIRTSDASLSSVNANADDLILENNGNCGMSICSSTSGEGNLNFIDSGDTNIGRIQYTHSDNNMIFRANDVERMRISSGVSGGLVRIGQSGAFAGGANARLGVFVDNITPAIVTETGDTSGRSHISFRNGNGEVGGIDTGGSSTSYNTSSDHRLKENVADMTGAIDRVKALAPKRFNFIADDTVTVDGFLAHEAQAVVPEAVTGTKDEVDDDGNAVMQGIDQAKLVPLLTAALKESIAKIEALEARVTALEDA